MSWTAAALAVWVGCAPQDESPPMSSATETSGDVEDDGDDGDEDDDGVDPTTPPTQSADDGSSSSASGSTTMADDDDDSDGGSSSSGEGDDTWGPGVIPDPGNEPVICDDVEPNDTPFEAVPCGPLDHNFETTGALYVFGGFIGDGDDHDFFVVRVPDGITVLSQFVEWYQEPVNLADIAIYEVSEDHTTAEEIFRSELGDTQSEPPFPPPDLPVIEGRDYLIEVISASGSGEYTL